MPANCLIISNRTSDLELSSFLESAGRFQVQKLVRPDMVNSFLLDNPQTIVFWDGDHQADFAPINQILSSTTTPERVFLVTDKALNSYPYFGQSDTFGHHLYRRFHGAAPQLIARLAAAVFLRHPFGVERYLPEGTRVQKIKLTQSGHRKAAMDALKNFLVKTDILPRLSDMAAQAADELIMNSIFDAPVDAKGKRLRSGMDRSSDFELSPKEQVHIDVGCTQEYCAISISDQFGSLEKDVILEFIRKNYQKEGFGVRDGAAGSGLGINHIIQKGLSLLFVSKPGVRTEVILFFPRATDFKEFREGFRFLSLISD